MAISKVVKNTQPELYIDGKRVPPILYALSDIPAAASNTAYAQKNIKNFSSVGINLICIDTEIRIGWHKATPFEADAMLAEVENVIDANPNAKILMRLHMNPPYWWLRDNPSEQVVYRTPDGDILGIDDGGDNNRLISHDRDNHIRVSLASEKWKNEASIILAKLCKTFSKSECGKALFAIQIACGLFGEWHKWGTWEDVSEPMQKRFKTYLIDKYKTIDNLKKAWNDDEVTFDTAKYHPEEFVDGDDGTFINPQKSQYLIDSRDCRHTIIPDAILKFAGVVKKHLPNVLTGSFYGYYFESGGDHRQIDRMYNSHGIIDFIAAPFVYADNRNFDGVSMQRGILESSRLRGMLWFTEMDQRPEGIESGTENEPENRLKSISVLRRNVIQAILAGQGLWYYDHRVILKCNNPNEITISTLYRKSGWWESPDFMAEIEKLQKLAERICKKTYKPLADVLIVYGRKSYNYRTSIDFFNDDKEYTAYEAVMRCGVGVDLIYIDELEVADIDRYKCIIFMNVYMIDQSKKEMIDKFLKGKIKVWLGPQGFCDGKALSCDNISNIVGMKISRIQKNDITDDVLQIEGIDLMDGVKIAMPKKDYCFYVDDSEVRVLAKYFNNYAAAAIKGENIYLPSLDINVNEMKKIIEFCGAHIWCNTGEPVYTGAQMVALNSPNGGMHIINLPNGNIIEYDFPKYSTLVFDSETGERLI